MYNNGGTRKLKIRCYLCMISYKILTIKKNRKTMIMKMSKKKTKKIKRRNKREINK